MRQITIFVLVAALVATGCVDQDKNAREFCRRNAELLSTDLDDQGVPDELTDNDDDREFYGELVEELENAFSKTMLYAEDATREVRNVARDVDDAYLDVHATYTDEDSRPKDLARDRTELEEKLAELREACSDHVDTNSA